jgi:hypothetical protein
MAMVAAVFTLLSSCATGRDNSVTATHSVTDTSVPAPVRVTGPGMDNTVSKSPAVARRSVVVAKTPCKIKGDSVEWHHLEGRCRYGYAHGPGRAESADGLRHYRGGFVAGRFDGAGNYDWGNGIRYSGHFVRGAKTGHGSIDYPDNRKYVGEFKDNLYHGAGRYSAADGSVYEGEFNAGRFHGRGVYRWADGDKYTGQFRDDLMEGSGTYVRANGETYSGQFSHNQRNGAGSYRWSGGDRYTGAFKDNEINGEGTYYHADGTKYTGQFVNGKKHGWGLLVAVNGAFRQRWNHGQKVSEEKVPATAESSPAPPPVDTSSASKQ